MRRKVKEANKYISLERLLEIQADQYRGVNGQEYYPESIDSMIWEKQSKNDNRNMVKALVEMEKLYIGLVR